MIRSALAVAVLAFGATALVAQNDPIAARKALMKSNGGQDRIALDMVQAKRPFDLDEAKKALATFAEAGEKAPALFPDDSKFGDTAALPAAWEHKADFTAPFPKLAHELQAAIEGTTAVQSLKIPFTQVRQKCIRGHRTDPHRA